MVSKHVVLMLAIVTFCVSGCDEQFVRARIKGATTNPIIHVKDDMHIQRIEVAKVEKASSNEVTYIRYWGAIANNEEQEIYTDQVQYGDTPEGWEVYTPAKQLLKGYYLMTIAEHHRVSEAGFLIVKNSQGELSLIGIDEPYNYNDEFINCVEAHSYLEEEVKSECFSKKYLRKW